MINDKQRKYLHMQSLLGVTGISVHQLNLTLQIGFLASMLPRDVTMATGLLNGDQGNSVNLLYR